MLHTIPAVANLLCLVLIPAPVKEDRLTLRAHFAKETYKQGDPVVLHLTFKNDGREMVYLTGNHLFPERVEVGPHRYFELRIFDDKGARLHFWGEHMSEGRTSWRVIPIEAGRDYKTDIRLSAGSFATVDEVKRHKLGIDSKKYRVSLHYTPPEGTGGVQKSPRDFDENRRWAIKLESNELMLRFE